MSEKVNIFFSLLPSRRVIRILQSAGHSWFNFYSQISCRRPLYPFHFGLIVICASRWACMHAFWNDWWLCNWWPCSVFILQLCPLTIAMSSTRPLLENGKNPSKFIKYSPENLETRLGELFEGKSAAAKTMAEPRRWIPDKLKSFFFSFWTKLYLFTSRVEMLS